MEGWWTLAGVLNVDRKWKHLLKIDATWDFPGSPVVKTLGFQCIRVH